MQMGGAPSPEQMQAQEQAEQEAKLAQMRQMFKVLKMWILIIIGLVVIMMVIGAITRLTDSGLSIVEWHVIADVIPPLSQGAWEVMFEKYKQLPEYKLANSHFGLEEFKSIYWWEYIHRLWGRIIGFAYIIPLFFLIRKGYIPSGHRGAFIGILTLGAAQALAGKWMVSSGLGEGYIDVSATRLAVHLTLAMMILYYLVGKLIDISRVINEEEPSWIPSSIMSLLRFNYVLIIVTIISGALVAGLRAGMIYNEYPLMGGLLIPSDYNPANDAFIINASENPAAAQLHHRILTVIFVISTCVMCGLMIFITGTESRVSKICYMMLAIVGGQFIIGIGTLLMGVPIYMGVLHQIGAIAVFLIYTIMIKEVTKWEPPKTAPPDKHAHRAGGDM